MVRLSCTAEPLLPQASHDLIHVHVTIVWKGLNEMRQRPCHIAEMHLEDLSTAAEITDHLEDILAHPVPALRPSAHAERQSPIRAAARNLLGAAVAIVMGEQLGDSVHLRDRRVIRMEGQLYTCLLSHRENRLHEIAI